MDGSHHSKAVSVVNILAHVTKPGPGGDGSPGPDESLTHFKDTSLCYAPMCLGPSWDRELGPVGGLKLC